MSVEKHDDNCPGCQPVLIDMNTRKPMDENSPAMIKVKEVWAQTNLIEREAWHRVTCQNSQLPSDLRIAKDLADRIQQKLKATEQK